MTKVPKKIKNLFYNPKNDSLELLTKNLNRVHKEILKNTDFSKSVLGNFTKNMPEHDFVIPDNGVSAGKVSRLISSLFRNLPRWNYEKTMYNVAPPPMLDTVITKMFTALYNPNLVLDTASGDSLLTERKVINAIAKFIGWNKNYDGIFTFGGKATTMYGIKCGLKKCSSNSSENGVKDDVVVISTKSGHPSHISDAEWLGIGSNNVIRLSVDKNGQVNLCEMEKIISDLVMQNKKIACIIISGGTTNSMSVDPIKKVVNLRNNVVRKLNLDYSPHIHVDSVVGFPWVFFKNYSFKSNNLKINEIALKRISKIVKNLKYLHLADSFGIDFHKMGFCPYVSTLFMIKDKKTFSGNDDNRGSPFSYSIENSRPGDGPNTAYISLNILGVVGFQILIAHLTEVTIDLVDKIEKTRQFEVVNNESLGTAVLFIPCPPTNITFYNFDNEVRIRNLYTLCFINKIIDLGHPFYIDKVPSNSTGANLCPYIALKAYIMSPYSNKESSIGSVVHLQADFSRINETNCTRSWKRTALGLFCQVSASCWPAAYKANRSSSLYVLFC